MVDESEEQTSFSNLVESAHGFHFDIITVTKQTVYDLDKHGQRIEPGQNFNAVISQRYSIGLRKSTNQLVGTSHVVASSFAEDSFPADTTSLISKITLKQDTLSWTESLVGYLDHIISGGKYEPMAWTVQLQLRIVNSKVEGRVKVKHFTVDPATMKRPSKKTQLPVQIMKEVERK